MGKNKSRVALSGLARLANTIFNQTEETLSGTAELTKPQVAPKITPDPSPSSSTAAPPQDVKVARKASQLDEEGIDIPVAARPAKKRKIGFLGAGYEKYDATGLVPHYTSVEHVPKRLRKYYHQRERYFSLYSEGCLLDEEGWYSVTPELIADRIAERCRCDTIVDAFCGVGGNAIAFAKTCERVIAIDTSPVRLALARHNATIYGVQDRIEFILADFISFANSYTTLPGSRKIDIVFLSPPWGGPEYLAGSPTKEKSASKHDEDDLQQNGIYDLASIQPIHGAELFKLARKITPNVAYFLPRNTDIREISNLLLNEESSQTAGGQEKPQTEKVEVEEQWMASKLKVLTCYFGGLAAGQEDMFNS